VVFLGHPIDNLAAIGICECRNIPGHFGFFIVVLLVDRRRRLVFERNAFLNIPSVKGFQIRLCFELQHI
jgi:hypothetical protein